jgi:hypothetical protein
MPMMRPVIRHGGLFWIASFGEVIVYSKRQPSHMRGTGLHPDPTGKVQLWWNMPHV